jgi:hypothetical protein
MSNATEHEVTGWRYIDGEAKPGDTLPNSYNWDTEEELDGTCAFETREACEAYARFSSGCIAQIGGTDQGWGEMAEEMIIGDAVVISAENWRK